jgi:hypothetical protein
MMKTHINALQSELILKRSSLAALVEKAMRLLAFGGLLWSLGGMACLHLTTTSQPRKFMPLIMRESDSENARSAAIETWRAQTLLTNTQLLLGKRSPLIEYNLDVQLNRLTNGSYRPFEAAQANDKERSFEKRLFVLNVGVERFCRDYWLQVRHNLEFQVLATLACILCMIFPRILPSGILIAVTAFAGWIHLNTWSDERQSLLWVFPILVIAILIGCLALYRWWIAPASAEITNDWNKFWLGLLLTGVGVGAFFALIAWGGRVRSSGLGGLGLCIGWGVYLVAVHGWKLIRSVFSISQPLVPSNTNQAE